MAVKKFALVIVGRDENIGMMFVGGEVLEIGGEMRYFDGNDADAINKIVSYKPDYICFSPLCLDVPATLAACRKIKKSLPEAISVFGGPHILAMASVKGELDEFERHEEIDFIVVGPVRGTITKVMESAQPNVIYSSPTTPADMPSPARRQFYEELPRLAGYYAKSMISMFGCPFDCSFCSNYVKRSLFSPDVFKDYFLARRPISELVKEGKVLLDYDTLEVDWEDDDLLFGNNIESWLSELIDVWEKEVGLPIRFMAAPNSILAASDALLKKLSRISHWCIIGVQCGSPASLKLFNRTWQTEEMAKAAHDRMCSFGFSILLQTIVGLPVEDPVEDAIQTIMALKRIGKGSMANAFPLLLYPGTRLYRELKSKGVPINEEALENLHLGIPSIKFSDDVTRKIRNISKLVKIFVKYDLSENWIRALVNIKELGDDTNALLANAGYIDCVKRRWSHDEKTQSRIMESLGKQYLKY